MATAREDFTYDRETDSYACPGGKELLPGRRAFQTIRPAAKEDSTVRYRAAKGDCQACPLKPQCCPNMPQRNISRSIHEGARDLAREITSSDAYVASAGRVPGRGVAGGGQHELRLRPG